MKNILFSTALLTLICTASYAAPESTAKEAAAAEKPNNATQSSLPSNTAATAPVSTEVKTIDCNYNIPATTTSVEPSVILTWAKYAAVKSFEFTPPGIDTELQSLKVCYTDQGWQGFNEALQKSGNINAIKSQHLTVSSQINGQLNITPVKDNQWKVNVPLQVVYQNDKQKLTQNLSVDLLIGRKITGNLGIIQMIATPLESSHPENTPK